MQYWGDWSLGFSISEAILSSVALWATQLKSLVLYQGKEKGVSSFFTSNRNFLVSQHLGVTENSLRTKIKLKSDIWLITPLTSSYFPFFPRHCIPKSLLPWLDVFKDTPRTCIHTVRVLETVLCCCVDLYHSISLLEVEIFQNLMVTYWITNFTLLQGSLF
jgi:hypothetical protein